MRWPTYHQGVRDTEAKYAALVVRYEALLAHAKAELATKERERAAAVQRGDVLMEKLLSAAGLRGVTAVGHAVAALEREAARGIQHVLEDDHAFDEVAPGTPECQFASEREAFFDPEGGA